MKVPPVQSFIQLEKANKLYFVHMERYELGRQIGQGSFGRVCVAVDKVSRQSVVVKAISASRLTPRERMDVEREVQLLAHLQHPNVVEYVESFYSVERRYWH